MVRTLDVFYMLTTRLQYHTFSVLVAVGVKHDNSGARKHKDVEKGREMC